MNRTPNGMRHRPLTRATRISGRTVASTQRKASSVGVGVVIGGLLLTALLVGGIIMAFRMDRPAPPRNATGWRLAPPPPKQPDWPRPNQPSPQTSPGVSPGSSAAHPGVSADSLPMPSTVEAAAGMRRSALRGLDGDFARYWNAEPIPDAWRRHMQASSSRHLWPYFLSTALLVQGADQPPRTIAFYNPYADAALLTSWSRSEIGDRIVNATVILGSELDALETGPPAELPRWCGQSGPLIERLRRSTADFQQKFPGLSSSLMASRTGAPDPLKNRSLPLLEQRCLALSSELSRLCATRSPEPSAGAVADLMTALRTTALDRLPSAAINATEREAILSLGSSRLAAMKPAFATQFSDGCMVLLIDPSEPDQLLAAHFSGSSSPRLTALSACRHY
jgi:hypothetical protein